MTKFQNCDEHITYIITLYKTVKYIKIIFFCNFDYKFLKIEIVFISLKKKKTTENVHLLPCAKKKNYFLLNNVQL